MGGKSASKSAAKEATRARQEEEARQASGHGQLVALVGEPIVHAGRTVGALGFATRRHHYRRHVGIHVDGSPRAEGG